LEWQKFQIVYEEWDNEEHLEFREILEEKTFEPCIVPFAIKLKTGEVLFVGDVNKNLGRCECCSDFTIRDIEEFANIKLQ